MRAGLERGQLWLTRDPVARGSSRLSGQAGLEGESLEKMAEADWDGILAHEMMLLKLLH